MFLFTGLFWFLSQKTESDASDMTSINEDDSDVQILPSDEEITPTTYSSDRKSSSHDLIKKITTLLDELSDQNCEMISKELITYLDSCEKTGVLVDILFEKAVISEDSASSFAKLFKELSSNKELQIKPTSQLQFFKNLIVRKCETAFERYDVREYYAIDENLSELVMDQLLQDEKRTASTNLRSNEEKLKLRSIGVCRFIGELYVVGALNTYLIKVHIWKLLWTSREEDLECFCILMKKIGKVLEKETALQGKYDINQWFIQIDKIIIEGKVSSSTINMLKEVILLKKNGWIPIEEGQWSPVNPFGKKKYGRDFLYSLRFSPLSVKDPNLTVNAQCVLPFKLKRILSAQKIKPILSEAILKKNNYDLERDLKQNAVITESFVHEVDTFVKNKLTKESIKSEIEDEDEEESLLKNDESLKLKKATLEIVACMKNNNSDEIALQIMKLEIMNESQLNTVVRAIFEQAITETHLSETFAGLSLYLNNANFGWQAMKEGDPNDNLKKSLLECFQHEFQRKSNQAPILLFHFEEKLRLRGVISFFGHLYKIGMVSEPILVMGIKNLLKRGDDYSMEILCSLMALRKPIK